MSYILRSSILISLFFSICLIASTTRAQNHPERITLSDAITIALENNYRLEKAKNNREMAALQVRVAKADFLPSLNAGFSGSRYIGRQFNDLTGEVGNFTMHRINGRMSARLDLFSWLRKINNLKSSQMNARAHQDNVERMRQTIVYEAATAYLDMLVNKELLQIRKQNLEVAKERLKKIKEQVNIGAIPKADLYSQQSAVSDQKLQLTQSQNTLRLSRLQLLRILQLNPQKEYRFVSPDLSADSIRIAPKSFDLNQLIDRGLENRQDLNQQKMELKSIKYQLKATRGNQYPSLSLSSSFSSSYTDRQPFRFYEQISNRNVSRYVSASISIPLFNGFGIQNRIKEQKISRENQQLELKNQRMQIIQDITEAYNNYQSVVQKLEQTRESLKHAKVVYETRKEGYEVGNTSFLELNQANADYVEAQSTRIQAVYEYLFRKELLDYYTGTLGNEISMDELTSQVVD